MPNNHFSAAQCSSYTLLNESDRTISSYGSFAEGKCDIGLSTKWYRFSARAGATMPESCVPIYLCGTYSTGWVNGTYPTVHEGVASRQVCFNSRWFGCCWRTRNIRIQNCGSFYVYELKAAPYCPARYCGGPFDSSNLTSRLLIFYSSILPWSGERKSSLLCSSYSRLSVEEPGAVTAIK